MFAPPRPGPLGARAARDRPSRLNHQSRGDAVRMKSGDTARDRHRLGGGLERQFRMAAPDLELGSVDVVLEGPRIGVQAELPDQRLRLLKLLSGDIQLATDARDRGARDQQSQLLGVTLSEHAPQLGTRLLEGVPSLGPPSRRMQSHREPLMTDGHHGHVLARGHRVRGIGEASEGPLEDGDGSVVLVFEGQRRSLGHLDQCRGGRGARLSAAEGSGVPAHRRASAGCRRWVSAYPRARSRASWKAVSWSPPVSASSKPRCQVTTAL